MRKILNILLVFACILACVGIMTSCTGSSCASHSDIDSNGLCDMCGAEYTCPGHADSNSDGMCDNCLADFSCENHYDIDADLKCDVCKAPYICPAHTDTDFNGECDICYAPFTCPGHCDVNFDGKCDECDAVWSCPAHANADEDGKCDVCKAPWVCPGHQDSNGDGECDTCKCEFECEGHIDAGADGRCDRCDMLYTCPGHKDNDDNGKCDICLASYKKPVDYRSEFAAAAKATKPSEFKITIASTEVGIPGLTSTYTVTFAEDGSFTIVGTMQKYNLELSGDLVLSIPVNITCDKDGKYSDGGEFAGSNPAVTGLSIDFSKITNYSTPSAAVLNATIAKSSTQAVFGVEFANDVTLVVNRSAGKIVAVSVAYANVVISCEYK